MIYPKEEEYALQFIRVDDEYANVRRGSIPGTVCVVIRDQPVLAESMAELLKKLRARRHSVYLPVPGR
jgi:hypothetical protein